MTSPRSPRPASPGEERVAEARSQVELADRLADSRAARRLVRRARDELEVAESRLETRDERAAIDAADRAVELANQALAADVDRSPG